MDYDNMKFRSVIALALGCSLLGTSPAFASPKGDLKDQARTLMAELEGDGWPQSRCSLSASFNNGYIFASYGQLENGDKLLAINNIEVAELTNDEIVDRLQATNSAAVIPVRVERAGSVVEERVQCVDSLPEQEVLLKGLKYAGRKKVDECMETLAPIAARNPIAAVYRLQCASLTKNPFANDFPTMSFDAANMLIQSATFAPDKRLDAVRFLRSQQGSIFSEKLDKLVAVTTTWEGDEDIWETSKPDWYRYRVNAERMLLSGFFDPDAAIVEWPYGFKYGTWKPVLQGRIEGYWTCGRVNGKNRMGGYVGSRYFVVVMGHNAEVLYREVGDGGTYDFVAGACQNSVSQLPPAPDEFFEPEPTPMDQPAVPSAPSMADELRKLADLFEAGALTREEYDTAKAKVLEGG